MSKRKRSSCCSCPPPAQVYVPRTEVSLEALRHALSGCQMLVKFLLEEEGPDAPTFDMLDAAEADFDKARLWLKKVRR